MIFYLFLYFSFLISLIKSSEKGNIYTKGFEPNNKITKVNKQIL